MHSLPFQPTSMKRLNVFLRSAMTGELDQERAALRILFSQRSNAGLIG